MGVARGVPVFRLGLALGVLEICDVSFYCSGLFSAIRSACGS